MSTLKKILNNKPIGFFDSGVGGLSVYSKFRSIMPNENTLYFGDLKHLPYGSKSKEELVGFAREILDFFKSKEVKAVVIACNTSSAQAYDVIKDEYKFKIYPIIQSCSRVIASLGAEKIGVFATAATVASGAYTKELHKYNPLLEVKEIACKSWVDIVEGLREPGDEVKTHIEEMLKFRPDKIILGCTHYPYLMNQLRLYAPEDLFIDPAEIFVNFIKDDLASLELLNTNNVPGAEEIFVSANPESFVKHSKIFYDVKSLPEVIALNF